MITERQLKKAIYKQLIKRALRKELRKLAKNAQALRMRKR